VRRTSLGTGLRAKGADRTPCDSPTCGRVQLTGPALIDRLRYHRVIDNSMNGKVVDRRLYSWAAIVAALIIFVGFARTFYLHGMFATPALSLLL
jgi:hypothetical protein